MKIAYICADAGIPVFGQKGCSIHVQEVIRSLLAKNAEISLFTPRLGGEIPVDLQKVKIYQLPAIPKLEKAIREKVARSINHDLELELRLAQPFDFIYERYSLWSYSGIEFAQKIGIPSILEVNAPLIVEQDQHRGLVNRQEAEKIAQKVFESATIIIAVSSEVKNYVSQSVSNPDKIKIIPNGVNADRFSSNLLVKKEDNKLNSAFTIGFVGSLKPWHGVNLLIDSFARFYAQNTQSRLLIVGDGTERDSLKQEVNRQQLQSAVHFTGAVSPETIPNYLQQMDVAVAPYPPLNNFYFSPLKVYEYMAAGLPVIASNIGQITEFIDDGVNGLLIPAGDTMALTSALEKLWRSPFLRQSLGKSAHERILANYTWEKVAEKILFLAQK